MKLHGNIQTNATNQIASVYNDTGVADAYIVSTRPVTLALTIGLTLKFLIANANTGPATVDVDGLGPIPIKKDVSADLGPNDFLDGEIVTVTYDGTNFQWTGAKFATQQNGIVFGGQVTWVGPGYNYRIEAAGYYINFQYFTSPLTFVTLSAPDATLSRFDTFVVDNTGTASVVTGTPLLAPTEPPLDLGTQLRLGAALVEPGTTAPTINTECIYLENTEWTTGGTNGGRINPNSLTLPRFGIKDINGTNVSPNDFITFTRSSSFTPMTSLTKLNFWVRAKASWGITTRLVVQWYNGVTPVGNSLSLQPGTFGFITSDTVNYQLITMPLASFGLTPLSTVDGLRITAVSPSSFTGFYIDDMCLFDGDIIPTFTLPTFQNGTIYNPTTNTVEFGTNPLLHGTTLDTNSFIQTFSGAPVFDYPYKFSQRQSFQNSTSIASFQNAGSNVVGALDLNNVVKLGINYTGKSYNGLIPRGYFGPDNIMYFIGVNAKGHGSFGIDTENSNSKIAGIGIHTLDSTNTDAVSIYGKQPPNVNQSLGLLSDTGLLSYIIANFKTTKQVQFTGYGDGTFDDTPTRLAGFDVNGNILEVDPSDIIVAAERFAVSGEDDTGLEDRLFNIQNHPFEIGGTGNITLHSVNPFLADTNFLITPGGITLDITLAQFTDALSINNLGSGGRGVTISSSGTALRAFANAGDSSGAFIIGEAHPNSNNFTLVGSFQRTTSGNGGLGQNGIGGYINFDLPKSDGTIWTANQIYWQFDDVTAISSSMIFQGVDNGVYIPALRVIGTGQLQAYQYGVGNFDATPTRLLGTLVNGTVVEIDPTDLTAGITLALNDLTDVDITTPAEGNILSYNSGSGLWKNVAGTKFGVSGQDAIATEDRLFDATGFLFSVRHATSVSLQSDSGDDVASISMNSTSMHLQVINLTQAAVLDLTPTLIHLNSNLNLLTGPIQGDSYGSGFRTGTPAYNIAVDSSGHFIETSLVGNSAKEYTIIWSGNSTDDPTVYGELVNTIAAVDSFTYNGSTGSYKLSFTAGTFPTGVFTFTTGIGASVQGSNIHLLFDLSGGGDDVFITVVDATGTPVDPGFEALQLTIKAYGI